MSQEPSSPQPHCIVMVAEQHAAQTILQAICQHYQSAASWLSPNHALELGPFAHGQWQSVKAEISKQLHDQPVDIAVLPSANRRKRLLASDMDSTLITIECIDELADLVGLKSKIAAVTERAMAGELDFDQSLIERARCLSGVSITNIATIYAERVKFSEGALELVQSMRAQGARTILLSGGFQEFTGPVTAALGMDEHHSNCLLIEKGKLTGKVAPPIFGPEAKAQILEKRAQELGIELSQTLAIGDGANDMPMLQKAGLGIAYRAKPKVKTVADAVIDHTSLRSALYFQGYRDDEIRSGSGRPQNGDHPAD